jgi:hypothetical protein
MHLFAPEVGLLGTSGIVGPSILMATGAGYSYRLLGTDRVSVPDLEVLTARAAARALRDAGLELRLRAVRSRLRSGGGLYVTRR